MINGFYMENYVGKAQESSRIKARKINPKSQEKRGLRGYVKLWS